MTATAPIPPTRQELIRLLRKHKQEWRSLYGIQNITLFGSLARGEAPASSDVDLCVILDLPNPLALVHFRDAVQVLLGRRVDVVSCWQGMNPALRREVQRDSAYIATVRQLTPDTTKTVALSSPTARGRWRGRSPTRRRR